ncbi:OmpA family protein, partial [Halomonas sp. 3D7M]
ARSRTSGEYRFGEFITPSSQDMESPVKPGRFNLRLSEQRAKAVADALVAGGTNPQNIRYTGLGQSEPLVSCQNIAGAVLKECLAPNRRVEILLQENS